ncbi:uncharacterized protein LOC134236890 [Saccostrea cucullata]|uniref:uncharacterized protein LOC134236890 n=1 Tax=Saccostrea cuccullata TaxID=36930 RepID=UPI002ED12268
MPPKNKTKRNCRLRDNEGKASRSKRSRQERPAVAIEVDDNHTVQEPGPSGSIAAQENVVGARKSNSTPLAPAPVPALAIESQSGTSIGYENQYVDSIHSLLASNVSNSLKSKIISSAYIEISLLLDNTSLTESSEKKIFFNEKGELVTREVVKPSNKIQNISRWTDAFLVYSSIYASAHPESYQGLLKYLHDIRLGASRCGEGDLGWKKYDEQFRLRRSIDPTIDWSKVDYELWLMFMSSSPQSKLTIKPNSPAYNKCYNFNFKGHCDRPSCQYMHKCIKCSGSHPQYLCPQSNYVGKSTSYPRVQLQGQPQVRPLLSHPTQTPRPQRYMGPRKFPY